MDPEFARTLAEKLLNLKKKNLEVKRETPNVSKNENQDNVSKNKKVQESLNTSIPGTPQIDENKNQDAMGKLMLKKKQVRLARRLFKFKLGMKSTPPH